MEQKKDEDLPLLLFKYGGNAMRQDALKDRVLDNICRLTLQGYRVVIAHGGGPFIAQVLEASGKSSTFIDGHRQTPPDTLKYVEMALKGVVNNDLTDRINQLGFRAVGLTGKDARMVTAVKRRHTTLIDGKTVEADLGRVGDVQAVDVRLLQTLLRAGYIPVVACLAAGDDGMGYNVNGDLFAGHLAGALHAEQFIVLTDVDGLLLDRHDTDSLLPEIALNALDGLVEKGVIEGGMLPKTEACRVALLQGAAAARILNGTKPEQIRELAKGRGPGTVFTR